jgi:hypothetical protein
MLPLPLLPLVLTVSSLVGPTADGKHGDTTGSLSIDRGGHLTAGHHWDRMYMLPAPGTVPAANFITARVQAQPDQTVVVLADTMCRSGLANQWAVTLILPGLLILGLIVINDTRSSVGSSRMRDSGFR